MQQEASLVQHIEAKGIYIAIIQNWVGGSFIAIPCDQGITCTNVVRLMMQACTQGSSQGRVTDNNYTL